MTSVSSGGLGVDLSPVSIGEAVSVFGSFCNRKVAATPASRLGLMPLGGGSSFRFFGDDEDDDEDDVEEEEAEEEDRLRVLDWYSRCPASIPASKIARQASASQS